MHKLNGVPAEDITRKTYTALTRNVVDTVVAAGDFSTFAAAIKTAGLTAPLGTKGPFTVFAPTDEAFRKLPSGAYEVLLKDPAKLAAIMNYHVIPGYFDVKDLKSGELKTLQGTTLTAAISAADAHVNGARITRADLTATNGVVHGIDAVILPKRWRLAVVPV
jgi:uncharacterized surface protein with fasciclin (FAS1) repeats